MGILNELFSGSEILTNKEAFTSKKSQAGFGNVMADVPINVDTRINAPTTNLSDSRQFIDARQISIISQSPESSITSKKADKLDTANIPSQSGATTPVEVPVDLGFSVPSAGNILLFAGLGLGAYFLIKGVSKK